MTNRRYLLAFRFGWLSALASCGFFLAGCGGSDTPPLGRVTGTVTMDGEPLVGIVVNFKPNEGRMATGLTDAKGHYDLEYVYREMGTKVGPNTVSFSWPTGVSGSVAIPPEYSYKSELQRDVKAGSNTMDFDLKSNQPGGAKAKAKTPALPE